MEHPFFALRTGDTHDRHYEHNGNTIDIMPTSAGIATIQDKDVWIYCLSSIMNAIRRIYELCAKHCGEQRSWILPISQHLNAFKTHCRRLNREWIKNVSKSG